MKKIISALFLSIILLSSAIAKENPVSFSAGLSTGVPFYGAKQIENINNAIKNPGRIIVGTYVNANFNVIDQVSFFLGADLLSDFIWGDNQHSNHLHFALPIGLKIYPDLAGFNFGISYLLGFRADFLSVQSYEDFNGIKSWGNGFKFHTEYNFAKKGKWRYLPTIGFSWSLMPRGSNSYDNILTFYTGVNF